MKLNPNQFELDYENYRLANGPHSLLACVNRKDGKLWVVRKETPVEVLLRAIFEDVEQTVTLAKFSADFQPWFQDEAVFYLGTNERREVAIQSLKAVTDTIKVCMYGKAQLPVLKARA